MTVTSAMVAFHWGKQKEFSEKSKKMRGQRSSSPPNLRVEATESQGGFYMAMHGFRGGFQEVPEEFQRSSI